MTVFFFSFQNVFIWNWLRQVNHRRIFPFSTLMDCNKRGFAAVADYKNLFIDLDFYTPSVICIMRTRNSPQWWERETGIAAGFRKWLKIDCSPAYFLTDPFFNSWLLCYKTDLCSHRYFSDAWLTVQDRNSSFFEPISYCFSCVFYVVIFFWKSSNTMIVLMIWDVDSGETSLRKNGRFWME